MFLPEEVRARLLDNGREQVKGSAAERDFVPVVKYFSLYGHATWLLRGLRCYGVTEETIRQCADVLGHSKCSDVNQTIVIAADFSSRQSQAEVVHYVPLLEFTHEYNNPA